MDVAACRKGLFRWAMGAMFALLMPFTVVAQSTPAAAEAAGTTMASEEEQCRACSYERIGRKVDIGLVTMMAALLIGVLVAVSREWGTPSQRWTCRSAALFLLGLGTVLAWRAGSVLYLGYNPWQEASAAVDAGWVNGLLTTSPKWLMAVLLIGAAPALWKRSERLPRWRIS